MITQLLFQAAIKYIIATNPVVTTDDAYTLVESINEYSRTEDDFLYFLSMAEVESMFNIRAVNKTSGAYGAFQVMPMHIKAGQHTPTWAIKIGIQQYYQWRHSCDKRGIRGKHWPARYYNGGYRGAKSQQTLTYARKIDRIYKKHKRELGKKL